MKVILWIAFCVCFAYMIAKYYPAEYVSIIDGAIVKVETFVRGI